MDRRDFFRSMFAASLLSPFILASKKERSNMALYLIEDNPQLFIPFILEELHKFNVTSGHNFTFQHSHHKENSLKQTLSQKGWKYVQRASLADLTFSFSHLYQKASPSFTLIKNGRIWDIRSRKLRTLWREMNENHNRSSCLTIASFKARQIRPSRGEFISVYQNGHKTRRILLKENLTESFGTEKGKVTVRVKSGEVWIVESSCPHKICTYSAPISLAGERIICAPNHFLLEIQRNPSIDATIG